MNYTRLKYACYTTNVTMSAISNISPILFVTFHTLYSVSYSLLGLLVLVNFFTQLLIDLAFSFFSHRFNIPLAVRLTPVIAAVGMVIYAVWPFLFPGSIYLGLVIGTVIFSSAGGLAEVLISPVIAAIPSDNPDREMSKLHSVYAWGVVGVILVGTVYLFGVGSAGWQWLVLLLALIPISSAILFAGVEIPQMQTPERASGVLRMLKNPALLLCIFAIFLGGAAECTMAQWSSSYLEQALGIPKLYGDIFGVALFAVALGLGRSLYAKRGKYIGRVLLLGAIGATACYLTAAVSPIPVLGLLACAFTGFCTSMLWPGSLIVSSDRFPQGGVVIYAMMAAGGDCGAALVPQLVGLVTDGVAANPNLASFAASFSLSPEQLGMKVGMLVAMLFPLTAIAVYARIRATEKKHILTEEAPRVS